MVPTRSYGYGFLRLRHARDFTKNSLATLVERDGESARAMILVAADLSQEERGSI